MLIIDVPYTISGRLLSFFADKAALTLAQHCKWSSLLFWKGRGHSCWVGRVPACTEAAHALIKSCQPRVYPHVTSFTRPSSRLTNSFFPASKIVIAEESEREGLGTRLLFQLTSLLCESRLLMTFTRFNEFCYASTASCVLCNKMPSTSKFCRFFMGFFLLGMWFTL